MPPPRPELENPPEVFYNATEARRYTVSTRIRTIQRQMTLRALELLNLPKPIPQASASGDTGSTGPSAPPVSHSALLLDIGCGSGISGDVLTEQGHAWVGVDISADMLAIAKEDELRRYELIGASKEEDTNETCDFRGSNTRVDTSHVKWGLIKDDEDEEDNEDGETASGEGDDAAAGGIAPGPDMVEVVHNDIGQGLPFRPGTFDGCVSISVIQWLCHSTKRGEVPQRRLHALFQALYNSLRRGAKAVLQFYPSSPEQINMITKAAMKCGFGGGVVVDYPHSSKAKKHYLVLQAGQVAGGFVPPPGLTGTVEEDDDDSEEMYGSERDEYGEDEEGEEESGEEGEDPRQRVRVAGRDRERVKRSRAASSHTRKRRRKDNRPVTGTREWVLLKKAERRQRGLPTTADSKYTMRPRKPRF